MYSFSPCSLGPGSRVWLYFRDSGGDAQDTASQRSFGLAYCEHYRLHVDRVFVDAAISGRSVTGREEFELMIELTKRGKKPIVDAILYWDTKRFARNQDDSQFYKADLRRRGYQLVSLSDGIPDGAIGRVYEAILEWKAQQDLDDLSKDAKRGLAYIVGLKDTVTGQYLGIFPGRPPTFFAAEKINVTDLYPETRRNDGRARVLQRIFPDPKTWELGKLVMEMRATRASYREIEAETKLFSHCVRADNIYATIFRNEIYIGRLRYGGRTYENFVPALATLEQWEAIQKLAYRRPDKGKTWPAGKKHPKSERGAYLLSGLCTCRYCQGNMHGETNRRRDRQSAWRYYLCATKKRQRDSCPSKQVSAEMLERTIINMLCGRVLTVEFIEKIVVRVNAYLNDDSAIQRKIDQVKKKIVDIEKAISNLLQMAEMTPSVTIARQLEVREFEHRNLEKEIDALSAQAKIQRIDYDSRVVVETLNDWRTGLTVGEIKARQVMLRQFVDKVEVGRDSAKLTYRFPLTQFCSVPPTGFELNLWQLEDELAYS